MATLQELLKVMLDKGASDLHLTVGSPPQIRVDGSLFPLTSFEAMTPIQTNRCVIAFLLKLRKNALKRKMNLICLLV